MTFQTVDSYKLRCTVQLDEDRLACTFLKQIKEKLFSDENFTDGMEMFLQAKNGREVVQRSDLLSSDSWEQLSQSLALTAW